jgi:hypothetical protein
MDKQMYQAIFSSNIFSFCRGAGGSDGLHFRMIHTHAVGEYEVIARGGKAMEELESS